MPTKEEIMAQIQIFKNAKGSLVQDSLVKILEMLCEGKKGLCLRAFYNRIQGLNEVVLLIVIHCKNPAVNCTVCKLPGLKDILNLIEFGAVNPPVKGVVLLNIEASALHHLIFLFRVLEKHSHSHL